MPVQPDDLQKGMWLVITGDDYKRESFFGQQDIQFTGYPFKVVEVALPFICITDGEQVRGLDVRRHTLTRVSAAYARSMIGHKKLDSKLTGRKRRKKKDKSVCPRCGDRMIQRLDNDSYTWHIVCPTCGLDNGEFNAAKI